MILQNLFHLKENDWTLTLDTQNTVHIEDVLLLVSAGSSQTAETVAAPEPGRPASRPL